MTVKYIPTTDYCANNWLRFTDLSKEEKDNIKKCMKLNKKLKKGKV